MVDSLGLVLILLNVCILVWGLTEGEPHLLWEALWEDSNLPPITVEFDDFAVRLRQGDQVLEEFWWDNLSRVVVYTDFLSLIREDFFFVLCGETQEQETWIGLTQATEVGLANHIQAFPEFDRGEYIEAQRSTVINQFIVWEREDTDDA